MDLDSGRLVALEALAPWEHPTGGVDDPRRFIPAAEDSDLITELDLAVIRHSFTDLKRWQTSRPALRLSSTSPPAT